MSKMILGIETSCDETAAAVYDSKNKKILSSHIFSQIKLHEVFGGVVPEIASRSHLEKINIIVEEALKEAHLSLDEIDVVAVTNTPGLVGSLLIGTCFAKGIAWAKGKALIGVNHLEGHIFSAFLEDDMSADMNALPFPHISLSVSGGHSSFYLVKDFGVYEQIGSTLDDAAGEAFDKVAQLLGLGYPGGAVIEKLAKKAGFKDFFSYPRSTRDRKDLKVSFSGIKTAVLYDLVKRGAFNLKTGIIKEAVTEELQMKVASSLLISITDSFVQKLKMAFKLYPEAGGFSFVGGVACNKYMQEQLKNVCDQEGKSYKNSPKQFSMDNAGMIAFVGGYKAEKGEFSDYSLDVQTTALK